MTARAGGPGAGEAGGTSDRYAVIGHPVAHSRSPWIHAAFAAACGERLHYGRLESPLDGFEACVRGFAASTAGEDGVKGPARGCNITVPFKLIAHRLATRCSERARLAEAVNTLRFDAEGWYGDNTDGAGLVRDITVNAGTALAGRRVLLLGAGGAAAGALGPLLQAAPSELRIVNRTAATALALAARHAALADRCGVRLTAGALDEAGHGHDVLVNASASSLQGAAVPLPGAVLRRGGLALDMMYGPAAAGFLAWAADHGAQGRDGLGMLVEQAAEAFAVWRGQRPETASVLAALRQQLATAA